MAKKRVRANGEGSVYRQKENLWAAAATVNGKRKYFYGKTQKEAKDKREAFLRDVEKGVSVDAKKQTVAAFLQDWLENSQKQSLRPRSYERYEEVVRLHIAPVIGQYQLQKLSPQHVQALYAQKQDEGYSSTTVLYIHNVLHKALKSAVRWGLVARNVCELVDPPRREDFEGQTLTVEQSRKLLEAARGLRLEALFVLALATGMRRGEIMGLKWQDINFGKGELQIRRVLSRIPSKLPGQGFEEAEPKTQKSKRKVVIAPFALAALKKHLEQQLEARAKAGNIWQDHDYVFCTSIGTHLNPDKDIRVPLKRLLQKAGLPDIRFHDLRHSTASLLFSEGVHPKIVQEILGHSNIRITLDIYSHMLPTMQDNAMRRLDDLLRE